MTWLINSYRKTKAKWEWMVTPLIVILTFLVGLLNAIFLGVACSTFIFVASFYRSGVVKFLANGLTVRSTIERAHREASWLDQNGDYIQVVVLQNYLFFGNAQSILTYIQTMFEGDDRVFDVENHVTLPPHPHHLILDFSIVSGMDTSAQDVLGEIVSLCQKNKCRLYLAGLAPNLRSNLLYAGLKPEPRKFSFQPDLESSLGKAEDSLLRDVFLIFEKEKHDAGVRRRVRSVSDVEDGFQYALRRIDEQHGTNFLPKLVGLERYTSGA
jgi:SulP family sulfate permease